MFPVGKKVMTWEEPIEKNQDCLVSPFVSNLQLQQNKRKRWRGCGKKLCWHVLSWHLCLAQTTALKVLEDLKSHFQPIVDVSSFFRGSHGSPDVPKGRNHENTLSSITCKEKRIFLVKHYVSRIQSVSTDSHEMKNKLLSFLQSY